MFDKPGSSGKNTQDRSPGGLTAEGVCAVFIFLFFLTVTFFPVYLASELQELSLLRLQLSMTDNVDDKQQGDAHVPEEPIAFPRDRFFRQQRSTTGKLAYVVFGITEECGVYYNWYIECVIILTAPDIFFQVSNQTVSLDIPPLPKARQ